MNVTLLSRSAHPLHPPGGMERAVYDLACHLAARGVGTTLVTRPATRNGTFPGQVLTVPYGPEASHGGVLDRSIRYPRFVQRVGRVAAELVRTGAADIVDAQGLTALGYGRLRARDHSLRAPLVMNPQGMEEHKTRGFKRLALTRLRVLSREAARLADRVVATDEATRGEVPLLLGVDPEKVVVVPNGVSPEAIVAMTPTNVEAVVEDAVPGLAGATLVLLSVGRLETYKGFGDVLGALASLHARDALPEAWAWVLVGTGPAAADLRARMPAAVATHVHLAGRVSDEILHALYARADLFVHATRFEGSSLVTLEAMAHALPVVATRTGGIPDKVADGETGLLVTPGDVPGLAGAIETLARGGGMRKEMGRKGRERCLASFSWPRIIGRVLDLYADLLETRRR